MLLLLIVAYADFAFSTPAAWRKVLKDLIAYFREIQNHYEHKSKSLVKLANVSNNISTPAGFLNSAGVDDALDRKSVV